MSVTSSRAGTGRALRRARRRYVLKTPFLRGTGPRMEPTLLRVSVLSCQRLPNNAGSRDILDPYVKVLLPARRAPRRGRR